MLIRPSQQLEHGWRPLQSWPAGHGSITTDQRTTLVIRPMLISVNTYANTRQLLRAWQRSVTGINLHLQSQITVTLTTLCRETPDGATKRLRKQTHHQLIQY